MTPTLKQRIEEAAEKRTISSNAKSGFVDGAHFGIQLAIEILKSKEAERGLNYGCEGGIPPKAWADFLEANLKRSEMECLECKEPVKPKENKPWPAYCSKECFEAAMKRIEK